MTRTSEDLTCVELVELVTDYLEGALPPEGALRFEEHLRGCEDCAVYFEQMQTTVELVGRLCEDDLTDGTRERLLQAFRGWKRGGTVA